MSDFEALVEDHATQAVPDDQTVSGVRIALIIIGVAITVPAFLVGAEIAGALGLASSIKAFIAGAIVIAAIGALNGAVAAKSRLSTAMILNFSFGSMGAKAVNALFALALFGWFGVTAALFGRAVAAAAIDAHIGHIPPSIAAMLGGVIMTATTIFGFKALDRLSLVAAPLLIAVLGYGAWRACALQPWPEPALNSALTFGAAVSAVAGGYMVGVTLMPDLCRYAPNARQAGIAAGAGFLVGYPLVLSLSALPSLAIQGSDFLANMVGLKLGAAALLVIVFATWTTNVSNLYSNALMLAALAPAWRKWAMTIFAGVCGTLMALTPVIDKFVPFLVGLGVALPPVSGIYIADFFLVRRRYDMSEFDRLPRVNFRAFAAWAAGTAIAALTLSGNLTLTTIPACDSILAAFICYILLNARVVGLMKWRKPSK